MTNRRITLAAIAAVVATGGSAVAIAATTTGDEAKRAESAILSDAAQRLDTSPEKLRAALGAAQDAELDRAVKAGRLTQEQADAIKARRAESGSVLGRGPHGGPGGRGHHGGRGHGGPGHQIIGDVAADAARALGLEDAPALLDRLRDGETLAEIAKAQKKDLADVRAAIKSSATDRLAAAVKDGELTDARRDRIVARLDALIDRLASGRPGRFGPGGRHGGPDDDAPRNENGALPGARSGSGSTETA